MSDEIVKDGNGKSDLGKRHSRRKLGCLLKLVGFSIVVAAAYDISHKAGKIIIQRELDNWYQNKIQQETRQSNWNSLKVRRWL